MDYLDNDTTADGQYSSSTILKLLQSFQDNPDDPDEGYSYKMLVMKLKQHYGNDIVVTSQPGKETVFTMLDVSNHILRQHCKNSELTNDDIIDMAATIINDDIRAQVYDLSKYPKFSEMKENDMYTPESLKRLLKGIVKSKAQKNPWVVECKRMAIGHSIIAATRPRSFISPILLGISVYLNVRLETC